ncbi:MAG TPA: molybdopterin oxidoreductase family protein [Burkholderiales bacterium]
MQAPVKKAPPRRTVVRAACPHDCPDTCALEVTVENGVAVKVEGAKDHPFTAGTLCTKVARYLERTYSEERVLFPMRRVGAKGEGRFERISWDQALAEIAERFAALAAEDPQQILPYDYAGHMGYVNWHAMGKRFFHRLGASLLDRTICSSAGKAGIAITLGGSVGMDPERFEDAKLILIWGSNPIVSNLHLWSRVQEAKRRGAKVIAIDPYRSLTAEKCSEHVAPLPGTDGALALAMMHVIVAEGLVDGEYVSRHTVGFDALKQRLADYPPQLVAGITGLPAERIVRLAREYATVKPAAIRLNYGMQRTSGGGMAARTIACLPALVGAWRDPAGGVVLTTAGFFGVDTAKLGRPDLLAKSRCPKPRTINMSAIGDALNDAAPPVRALYVYNSNPVAVAPESRKVIRGFSREDLFTVVHDLFLTDTCDYADIVLPATSQLEQTDVHSAYGHLYFMANNAAIAPLGESLPNGEVFRRLARKMGFDDGCLYDSDDEVCRQALALAGPYGKSIEWDALKREGWKRLDVPETFAPFAEGNFPTPSGKCEFYSETAKKMGIDPLPTFVPPRESVVSNPALAAKYPLAMISPPNRHFLNSSFANLPFAIAEAGAPSLDIHPDDARARGIREGDTVRIFNDRGAFTAKARVSDAARRGVVVALSVWWKKLSSDGANANEVTSQALTDLGRGATFYDCLVEVQPA